jgi:hypothetical protein
VSELTFFSSVAGPTRRTSYIATGTRQPPLESEPNDITYLDDTLWPACDRLA